MSKKKESTFTDLDERVQVKEPRKYAVILLNDDYTPMEFVIHILVNIFNKEPQEAYQITMAVHHQERGVAGIYPFEIAENKVHEVRALASEHGHPLNCTMEPV